MTALAFFLGPFWGQCLRSRVGQPAPRASVRGRTVCMSDNSNVAAKKDLDFIAKLLIDHRHQGGD
jgi:hypothetical protein